MFSGEAKKALERLVLKKQGKLPASSGSGEADTRDKKKRKKDRK
jgi:hypothetical protein